jgi:hypothetical protein
MKKTRISSQRTGVLCIIISFLAACFASGIKEKPQENQTAACKFDATRIVNKVLDSTNIARLYGFDKDGTFAIFKNDFIKKYNVKITSKRYYLSEDCDSLEHSIEARFGKCWFLEFIQIDSISENIYRLHYAVPYKQRGGFYDFNIHDYSIVDSLMIKYKAKSDTLRYTIEKGNK